MKPDDATAWATIGAVYHMSGRSADTIAAYQQAVKLKTDFAEAWNLLGLVYRDAGKTAEADAAFKKARELDPSRFK